MIRIPAGYYFESLLDWAVTRCAEFTRWLSEGIDSGLEGLKSFLCAPPDVVMLVIFTALIWLISHRRIMLSLGSALGMAVIIMLGQWEATLETMALVIVCTLATLVLGLPLAILMSFSPLLKKLILPLLDVMQTMPAYVYLVPAIAFFSISNTSGIFATVIFALPPIVRMTVLGIEHTPTDLRECSEAFGATPWNCLLDLELPQALPSIRAGLNQTVMMALSMVVIASLVGAGGVGSVVWGAICNGEKGVAFEGGLVIVILAIILDRTLQAAGSDHQAQGA